MDQPDLGWRLSRDPGRPGAQGSAPPPSAPSVQASPRCPRRGPLPAGPPSLRGLSRGGPASERPPLPPTFLSLLGICTSSTFCQSDQCLPATSLFPGRGSSQEFVLGMSEQRGGFLHVLEGLQMVLDFGADLLLVELPQYFLLFLLLRGR